MRGCEWATRESHLFGTVVSERERRRNLYFALLVEVGARVVMGVRGYLWVREGSFGGGIVLRGAASCGGYGSERVRKGEQPPPTTLCRS